MTLKTLGSQTDGPSTDIVEVNISIVHMVQAADEVGKWIQLRGTSAPPPLLPPVALGATFAGAVILGFHPVLIERSENRDPIWNGQLSGYGRSFRFVALANPSSRLHAGGARDDARDRDRPEARVSGSETCNGRGKAQSKRGGQRKQKRCPIQHDATFDQMDDGSSQGAGRYDGYIVCVEHGVAVYCIITSQPGIWAWR
ncbi:hypothetical protein LY78DRAFT_131823 [Colletotrichum sublineola]|nr:hypothetical protein LY78DRAFT_131823 [Colletotrichum sublineola]